LKRFPALNEIVSKVKKLVEANQKDLANEQLRSELYSNANKQPTSTTTEKSSPSPSVSTSEPTKRRRSSSSPNSINLVKKKKSNQPLAANEPSNERVDIRPGPSVETPKRREPSARKKNKESVNVNFVNDTIAFNNENDGEVNVGPVLVNENDKGAENDNDNDILKSKIEISMNKRALNDATNKINSNLGQTATTSDRSNRKMQQARMEKGLQIAAPSYSIDSEKSTAAISEVPLNIQTEEQKSLLDDGKAFL
jgi:hypothetical protein